MADDPANEQLSNQGGNGDTAPSDAPNAARDTDGRGSANDESVADPNVEAVTAAFEGRGADGGDESGDNTPASGISRDGPDSVDLEDFSGGSRREPGR